MKEVRYTFTIPIGDWSDDGHGRYEDFYATASKSIEAVRDAYFVAKRKLPKLCPEEYCDDYSVPPEKIVAELRAAGAPLSDKLEPEGLGVEGMAAIVVWYLNQGDPDLAAELAPHEQVPTLVGTDKNGRHIGHIGYGLLGD